MLVEVKQVDAQYATDVIILTLMGGSRKGGERGGSGEMHGQRDRKMKRWRDKSRQRDRRTERWRRRRDEGTEGWMDRGIKEPKTERWRDSGMMGSRDGGRA